MEIFSFDLVKADGVCELRNPIGYDVQIIKCADLDEADAKAKEVLEAFFLKTKLILK